MTDKLYSPAEAAELSGKKPATVRKYGREHSSRRIGNQFVYTEDDIAAIRALPDKGRWERTEEIRKRISVGQKKRRKRERDT